MATRTNLLSHLEPTLPCGSHLTPDRRLLFTDNYNKGFYPDSTERFSVVSTDWPVFIGRVALNLPPLFSLLTCFIIKQFLKSELPEADF